MYFTMTLGHSSHVYCDTRETGRKEMIHDLFKNLLKIKNKKRMKKITILREKLSKMVEILIEYMMEVWSWSG